MAETVILELRTAAGPIAAGPVEAAYARAIESLWRTATDVSSRAAILRGLRPPLEAARRADPAAVSLVVDGVEIG
jgi:hypothetical protein